MPSGAAMRTYKCVVTSIRDFPSASVFGVPGETLRDSAVTCHLVWHPQLSLLLLYWLGFFLPSVQIVDHFLPMNAEKDTKDLLWCCFTSGVNCSSLLFPEVSQVIYKYSWFHLLLHIFSQTQYTYLVAMLILEDNRNPNYLLTWILTLMNRFTDQCPEFTSHSHNMISSQKLALTKLGLFSYTCW